MKKLFILLFISLTQLAYSQTQVSGGIFANTVWTAANSPYLLTGPIVVFPGNTLTIEPGVTVKVQFKGYNTGLMSYIELRGNMVANGTSTMPIKFEAELNTTDYTWRGIEIKSKQGGQFFGSNFEFNNSFNGISSDKIYFDTLSFNNCIFKHNNYAINLAGNIKLNNCTFLNNGAAMAAMISFGGVTATNCNFQNNGVCFTTLANPLMVSNSQFVGGRAAIMQCRGLVENCSFSGLEVAIENCYGLEVKNCILQQNGTAVLGANQTTLEGNIMIANNLGLDITGPCVIVNNDFNANQVGVKVSGMFEPGQTIQNFTENRLCFNSVYNLENGSDLNLGLEKNCFCLQDSAAIEALIYDGYDDFTRGLINFATYDTACVTLLKSYKKVQITTAIADEPIENQFLIYPNPASNEFWIKPSEAAAIDFIELYGMDGKLVKVFQTFKDGAAPDAVQFNVLGLNQGIYMLKIQVGNASYVKKMIIE